MNTVLITGCSSGYGLETARHFHARGWTVIATMRTPRAGLLPASERIRLLPLDVTSPESIVAALAASGPIDVLVNNAGIGMFGAFEATPMASAREVFETNTFGVMAMTRAVLPQFRARGSGVVVNVTSSATLAPMPLVAVYTASKAAIEGFTGSLAHELDGFGGAGQAGRARLRPDHPLRREQRAARRAVHPGALCALRARHSRAYDPALAGDHRGRRRRGGVARGERHLRPASLPGRSRRSSAGRGGLSHPAAGAQAPVTRQITSPTSSATRSAPSGPMVTPTGRP